MSANFNGYTEASKVNKLIGDQLMSNPITQENLGEWQSYIRTINKTSLKVAQQMVDQILDNG